MTLTHKYVGLKQRPLPRRRHVPPTPRSRSARADVPGAVVSTSDGCFAVN